VLQKSLNLVSTSGEPINVSQQGQIDNTAIICNTGVMSNVKKEPQKTGKTQQLRSSDEELWKQVKIAALTADKSMTEWVEDIIREHLATLQKSKKGGSK